VTNPSGPIGSALKCLELAPFEASRLPPAACAVAPCTARRLVTRYLPEPAHGASPDFRITSSFCFELPIACPLACIVWRYASLRGLDVGEERGGGAMRQTNSAARAGSKV